MIVKVLAFLEEMHSIGMQKENQDIGLPRNTTAETMRVRGPYYISMRPNVDGWT